MPTTKEAPSKSNVKSEKQGIPATQHDMLSEDGFNAIKLIQSDGSICRVQSLKIVRMHASEGKKRHGLDLRENILLKKSRDTIKSLTGDSVLEPDFYAWLTKTCQSFVTSVIDDLRRVGFRQEALTPIKVDVKLNDEDLVKTSVTQVQNIRMRNACAHIKEDEKLKQSEKERLCREFEIKNLRWSIQDLVSSARDLRKKIDETDDFIKKSELTARLEKKDIRIVKERKVLSLWTDGAQTVADAEAYLLQFAEDEV